jgi:hypothetical protein
MDYCPNCEKEVDYKPNMDTLDVDIQCPYCAQIFHVEHDITGDGEDYRLHFWFVPGKI